MKPETKAVDINRSIGDFPMQKMIRIGSANFDCAV